MCFEIALVTQFVRHLNEEEKVYSSSFIHVNSCKLNKTDLCNSVKLLIQTCIILCDPFILYMYCTVCSVSIIH